LEVFFSSKQLEALYVEGRSRKLRLPQPVIAKFFATVQKIEAALSIYDFWQDKGLKFEKLQGTDNRFSMRLSGVYRLEMKVNWIDEEKKVGKFYLEDISNHYK
jgi:plasmid maintenance system killer protein